MTTIFRERFEALSTYLKASVQQLTLPFLVLFVAPLFSRSAWSWRRGTISKAPSPLLTYHFPISLSLLLQSHTHCSSF